MTVTINVKPKNIIKVFLLATAFVIGILAIWRMWDSLILIMIAFFIALALNPAVSLIAKYTPGKKRGLGIAIVYIGVIAAGLLLLGSMAPPVAKETGNLAKNLPQSIDNFRYRNKTVRDVIDKYQLSDNIDNLIESSKKRVSRIGGSALNSVGSVTNSLLKSLTVLVLSVLILTGGQKLLHKVMNKVYIDENLKERHMELLGKMYRVVTGYVNGQVIVAFIASLFAAGALFLLRIPYPLPLAGLVFFFGLIPLIGNTIASILVVSSALIFKNMTAALLLLAFFVLYQQIENATLQPIVQGKTTQLPPLVIFVSVILGVALIGPIGGLFAIPAAGCAKVLLRDYLEHREQPKVTDTPKTLAQKVKHKVQKVVS